MKIVAKEDFFIDAERTQTHPFICVEEINSSTGNYCYKWYPEDQKKEKLTTYK